MFMKLDEKNFEEEVLKFNGAALVYFFAEWCGPCKVQSPIIDELEKEMQGQNVKIGKVDIEQNGELAEKYEVLSIPTLILFKDGEVKEILNGMQNKEMLKEKLMKLM
ncbi:thioredoxin [Patescibacteria group bacterium]|nr:thioredoxin [Patescibacteria group bacterium]